jgi:hypothetical protein
MFSVQVISGWIYSTRQLSLVHPVLPFKRLVHNTKYIWHFLSSIINIQFLCNLDHAYQISLSKNQNSIFGEFFRLIFMTLQDNSLKNIGDEFLRFDCGYMLKTSIRTSFILKNTPLSNKHMIYEELNVRCYMTKFCKIDISLL